MTYLVDFYLNGDIVDDECFNTLDEALEAKYGWQLEDTDSHYADVVHVNDDDKQCVVEIDILDHMVKAFFEVVRCI